jgi:hypothetical protein
MSPFNMSMGHCDQRVSRFTAVCRVTEWKASDHSLRRYTMSRLPSIRLASLGALALAATLAAGACANSPTGLGESTVQQDQASAGDEVRFGRRIP